MAKATVEVARTFILELSESERAFLLGVLQNPLDSNESFSECLQRQAIYEALHVPQALPREADHG